MVFLLLLAASSAPAQQNRSYELLPYPDVWYNDVDGIRVGTRIIGQVPGTFKDGPHRLNAGIWFSTWLPDYPVSYHVQFVEPFPSLSAYNSEANIELVSTVRTGIYRHSVSFNKRWQQGYNEFQFVKLSGGFTAQKRFENSYIHFPSLWQNERLWLGTLQLELRNKNPFGQYRIFGRFRSNLFGDEPGFIQAFSSISQRAELGKGFTLHSRLAAGISSNNSPPEFLFGRSFTPANNWVQKSMVRAEGTIPQPWFDSGIFQVAGGANLRGYSKQDIAALQDGVIPLLNSIAALNMELSYPNPINHAIRNIPVIGNLLQLRSYLFMDSGTSLGITKREESRVLTDVGLGFQFSFNIPDYIGNPRGIILRYDVPLWLSNPHQDPQFKYRSIIGIGAIFTL